MAKVRIYGKELQRWTATDLSGREITTQVEYSYKEYNEAGELVGIGSEDFSPERMRAELDNPSVYTWDGERRNKGGHRWFDYRGFYRIRKSERQAFKALMKKRYGAELVELRK